MKAQLQRDHLRVWSTRRLRNLSHCAVQSEEGESGRERMSTADTRAGIRAQRSNEVQTVASERYLSMQLRGHLLRLFSSARERPGLISDEVLIFFAVSYLSVSASIDVVLLRSVRLTDVALTLDVFTKSRFSTQDPEAGGYRLCNKLPGDLLQVAACSKPLAGEPMAFQLSMSYVNQWAICRIHHRPIPREMRKRGKES